MKKKIIIIVLFLMALPFSAWSKSDQIPSINTGFFNLKNEINQAFRSSSVKKGPELYAGITSHHFPTALPLIADFYKSIKAGSGPRNIFVLIGPDHFEKCPGHISVTLRPYLTPFGLIDTNSQDINSRLKGYISKDDQCLNHEHSLTTQAVMVRYLFPCATIIPIALSSATAETEINRLYQALEPFKKNTFILASVDFTHHYNYAQAEIIDQKSLKKIKELKQEFSLKDADSPPTLKFITLWAKKTGLLPKSLEHKNSFNFTGKKYDTTGYFSVLYGK